METPVVVLPALTDHAEYASVCANLEKLKADLVQAKNEANSAGVARHGSDSHAPDDVDKAVKRFLKDEQDVREARTRAEIRVAALERAIRREESKIPELHRQAVETVGRSAAEQYSPIVDRLYALRRELDEQWALREAISRRLTAIISDPYAPGYQAYDCGERFGVWGPPLLHIFGNPMLTQEAVASGAMRAKNEVIEPLKKEARGIIGRLKEQLGWGGDNE
jgi:hypothetical protein